MSLFVVILFLLSIFILYLGAVRNEQVFRYRMKLIDRLSEEAKAEIENDTWNPYTYLDLLKKVSYDEMVWKFWRPVDSFFPEKYRGL